MGVKLTSRLGMMDVSIRDMETRSVTDISIIEILCCLLPSSWERERERLLCSKACQTGQNVENNAIDTSLYFSHPDLISVSYLSLSFSPLQSVFLSVFRCLCSERVMPE